MKKIIVIILVVVLALGALIGAGFLEKMSADKAYNNGICPICGTEFHLVDIESYGRISRGVYYFYACENEHIIKCHCQPSKSE